MSEVKKSLTSAEALKMAKQSEADGNLEEAAEYYESVIKENSPDQSAFDRLMIVYRKLKQYKDELRVINRGLKVFGDLYKKPAGKSAKQQKLKTLSNAFMKSTGLNDKKGNPVYLPEPLPRWMKRKKVVENKL